MFKIGEFSQLGQVSVRMLRHYDQLGLLAPNHVDRYTGYRYYTIDQLARLHRIVALKELGLSLAQIGELLEGGDLPDGAQLRGMLRLQRATLTQEIQAGQARLARLEARLRQIEEEGHPGPYEIAVKRVPGMAIASLRQLAPTADDVRFLCERLYGQLYERLRRRDIAPLSPEITLYHNEEYTETDIDVEIGVPVAPRHLGAPALDDGIGFRELRAEDAAAALIYEGPFAEILGAILALLQWVAASGHAPAGPLRELHLSGPAHAANPAEGAPVVELQVPVRRRA